MKKYSIIIATLMFVFFVSCSSGSKSQNDSDIIPDADSYGSDAESIDDDFNSQDADIINDKEQSDDSDSECNDLDSDTDSGKPDKDYDFETSDDPYCETYVNTDYNVAYNYYGDGPTPSEDPESVKDFWSKQCRLSQCLECEPKSYDLCSENYPFEPQIIKNGTKAKNESEAGKFQCDALLTPGLWYANDLAISMNFNEFNGKILYGMDVYDGVSWQGSGSYVYNLNSRKVERLGRAYMDGWQNKKYYFISTLDLRIDAEHEESLYYGRNERHLIYYDKETNIYGKAFKMSETPTNIVDLRATDNYIFMSAHFSNEDASDMRIMYTKIGEWDKWKELTYKKETLYGNNRRAGYPSMIGSLVTYFDYDIQVQVCDLDVGDSSCFQVSRADEYGRYPIFKDKNTIIYSSQKKGVDGRSLVEADISDKNNIKYKTIYELSSLTAIQAADFEGDLMLFMRNYNKDDIRIGDACLYNYKTKKVVCMDEDFDLEFQKDDGFIYKNFYVFRSVKDLVIRDLECYCDFYPEKCPLIDYTPNPENPKEPWKRECGSK